MESLLGVLGQLAADMRSDSARRALLDAAWPAAVGERLRRHSRVASFARGRLVVEADDAAWARQLEAFERHILGALRSVLPSVRVRGIRVRVGRARIHPTKTEQAAETAGAGAPPRIVEAARGIGDPELRERLLTTVGAYLGRRPRRQ